MQIGVVLTLLLACALAEDRYEREIQIPEPDGKSAAPHSHPWLVALYNLQASTPICGGALLRVCEQCGQSDIILTAAHCVTYKEGKKLTRKLDIEFLTTIAGKHWTKGIHPYEQSSAISNVSVHPGWATVNFDNDIAIIRTKKPFAFNKNVTAIELPPANYHPPSGSLCTTAGWGYLNRQLDFAKELQEINGTIADHKACEALYANPPFVYNREIMTCMSAVRGEGGTACPGDSGGPLVCRNEKSQPITYGLVSFGKDFCNGPPNAVYTAVTPHLQWIYRTAYELTEVKKDGYLCKKAGVPCGSLD